MARYSHERKQAKSEGRPVPGSKPKSEQWSAQAKLATVIETATLSEAQLSAYCREIGLYPDQVKRWKEESLQGFEHSAVQHDKRPTAVKPAPDHKLSLQERTDIAKI